MGRVSKDKRDIYYRKAKEVGYRARSSFKLLQIDEEFALLAGAERAVDLCAAPGGWSQVLTQRLGGGGAAGADARRVVAVDLAEIAPLPGVARLQADITRGSTAARVLALLGDRPADVVVSDGAPDVVGLHDADEYVQNELVFASLDLAARLLRPGGAFVSKVFRGREIGRVAARLRAAFDDVRMTKPRACRNSSMEGFVVCRGFRGAEAAARPGADRSPLPFVSCGASALDADMSYGLHDEVDDSKEREAAPVAAVAGSTAGVRGGRVRARHGDAYSLLEPRAPPIRPPYEEDRRRKRAQRGAGSDDGSDSVDGQAGSGAGGRPP